MHVAGDAVESDGIDSVKPSQSDHLPKPAHLWPVQCRTGVAFVLEVTAFPEEQALPGLSGVLLTGAELSVAGGEVEKALIRLPGVDGITDGRLIRHNVLPNRWDYPFRYGSRRREAR